MMTHKKNTLLHYAGAIKETISEIVWGKHARRK